MVPQGGRQKFEQPQCGSWNLRDKKMFDNKKLLSWAVVSFAKERELPLYVRATTFDLIGLVTVTFFIA